MRSLVVVAGAVVTLGVVLGFRSGSGADQLARGRRLYQSGSYPSCALCHGLRSAVATSPFADQLDGAVVEDMKGKSKQQLESWVLDSIKSAQCFDPHDAARCMPKLMFTGKDAEAVALFIATCAAHTSRPGCKPVPALSPEAAAGLHDYQTLGCPSCHYANVAVAIAPSFQGLYGSKVQLANGKTVIANAAYLIASILTPSADTVKGYPHGLMASRILPGDVSRAQAKAIVAYLRTLR
jgi:cytochrome c oxidase subunit 2